jgi:hypothetical protein
LRAKLTEKLEIAIILLLEDFDAYDQIKNPSESLDGSDINDFWSYQANQLKGDLWEDGRGRVEVAQSSSLGQSARKVCI